MNAGREKSGGRRLWSALADSLSPYQPGEQPRQPGLVKLNTNEHPYPPSPRVLEAVADVRAEALRRYPDPESRELCLTAARLHGLQADQVFVGNGSDEVLSHVFMAFLKQPRPLCFPAITYSFYPVWCQLHGITYREIPMGPGFGVDPAAFDDPCGGIILPNPNAPTGRALAEGELEQLLVAHPDSVIVVDEAYVDFGTPSAVALIERFDNLLVVQTLSKGYALAGLRVGFAFGQSHLVEALGRVKNSFNSYPLGALAQTAAIAALQDSEYHRRQCGRVADNRDWLAGELDTLGFEVIPSAANFLFIRYPRRAGGELFRDLRQAGYLVRHFAREPISDYLRVSIGTEDECQGLVEALKQLL